MIKSVITNWQTHTLSLSEGTLNEVLRTFPDLKDKPIMVFTGTIVKKYYGHLNEGDHTRSSLILKIDRDRGLIKTRNSIYKVINEGNDVVPDLGNNVLNLFY